MSETKTEWYFIVNPRAGSGKTMQEWVPAERKLDKLGIPFITAYTDHKRHATTLAMEAASEGYRRIAAVGGDGSLHEVLTGICTWCSENGVPTSEFRMAVVPIGSGNDWIKSMGVPHDTSKVIDLIKNDSFSPMDIVRVNPSAGKSIYMANGAGTGFDSHVCEKVNLQKEAGMRGKRIYAAGLLKTIISLKVINVSVIADGKEAFSGPCYSIAVGNGRYSGGGMLQVPTATNNDGLLDVLVVPRISVFTIIREVPRIFNGTIHKCDKVTYLRCRKLDIVPLDAQSADFIEVDGELDGHLPISISIEGSQILALKGR